MQLDRASAYDSRVFRTGLAFLGVHRNWVKSRNPAAQGKIEAYHRSLKRWFVKELPHQQVVDIQHLETLLQATIALDYNRRHHREIKMTPEQALARRISTQRVGADQLAQAFKIFIQAKSQPKTGVPANFKNLLTSGRAIAGPMPNPASGCRKSFASSVGCFSARFPSTSKKLRPSRPSIEKTVPFPQNLFARPSTKPLMPWGKTAP
jgi:hypothetical protein